MGNASNCIAKIEKAGLRRTTRRSSGNVLYEIAGKMLFLVAKDRPGDRADV